MKNSIYAESPVVQELIEGWVTDLIAKGTYELSGLRNHDSTRNLPTGKTMFLTHNGSLVHKQTRMLRGFEKRSLFILPLALAAMKAINGTDIKAGQLVIGDVNNFKTGRSPVDLILEVIAGHAIRNKEYGFQEFVMKWFDENTLSKKATPEIILAWHGEWRALKAQMLVVTQELAEDRQNNEKWGSW